MRTQRAALFLVCGCLGALLSFACDDGPDAPPNGDGGAAGGGNGVPDTSQVSTYEAFVQRLTEAYCGRLIVPCCAETKPITQESCVSMLLPELREELLEDGGGTYLPARGAACVSAVDQLACGQRDDPRLIACSNVFERLAKPGKAPLEQCQRDDECGSPANARARCELGTCSSNGTCSPPSCQVEIHVALGEACSPTSFGSPDDPGTPPVRDGYLRLCPELAVCDVATRVCKPIPKVGERCDLQCVEGAACREQTCVALLPEGAACRESYDCASYECQNAVCVARPGQRCPLGGSEPN